MIQHMAAGTRGWASSLSVQVGALAAGLVFWYLVSSQGVVPTIILPEPQDVTASLRELVAGGQLWGPLVTTLVEFGVALAIAVAAGLAIGSWIGRSENQTRLLYPPLVWVQTVPLILIYPICILFLGLGSPSKIAFAAIYGFFPVAINTVTGLSSVEFRYRLCARALGASSFQTTWKVLVPAALPIVVTGVRMATALTLTSVLAAEILGSTGGLGYAITAAGQTFRTGDMYAYIVVTLVVVAAVNGLVSAVDRWVRW